MSPHERYCLYNTLENSNQKNYYGQILADSYDYVQSDSVAAYTVPNFGLGKTVEHALGEVMATTTCVMW